MAKAPTKKEREYMAKVKELPCGFCGAYGVDVHHLTGYGRRKGHMFTIPVCPEHHRNGNVSIHRNKKALIALYGKSEMDVWAETQVRIYGLSPND